MFSATNRTPFGGNTNNTSFGFGTTAGNPFGQTQMFGAPTNTSFGAAAPAFGQTSQPMFGQQQQSAPLFGTPTATPAFGAPAQNAFGGGALFGQPQQPQQSASLFSSPSNAFGQQNKPSGFSFQSNQPGLFGAGGQQPQQTANMFQQNASSNIFGASGGFGGQAAQSGTPIKFTPVTGTDSMQKGGSSTMINTKHHSITCMKEYEQKSFEELRFEDYAVNRKGAQSFGSAATTTPNLFGQPAENKNVFGTNNFGATPAFGQPSTSQSVFGKATPGFGATATSTGFAFNSTQPNIFGTSTANKPFGTLTSTPSLFGAAPTPAANTGFGTTGGFSTFGQPATTQTANIFNKSAATFATPPNNTFSFPATSQPGMFQTSKPSTGYNLFGQNTITTPAFGQTNQTGFSGFNSTFSKPAQISFAQPAQPQTGFNMGMNVPSNNLFCNIGASKPAFGATNTVPMFNQAPNQLSTGSFNMQPQVPIPTLTVQSEAEQLRKMVTLTDPFGYSPHLDGLPSYKPDPSTYVTSPKDIEQILKAQDKIVGLPLRGPIRSLKTTPITSAQPKAPLSVFESIYDDDNDTSSADFKASRNTRKLNIKGPVPKAEPLIMYDKDGNILGNEKGGNSACTTLPSAFQSPLKPAELSLEQMNNNTPVLETTVEDAGSAKKVTLNADVHQNGPSEGSLSNKKPPGETPPAPQQTQPQVTESCGIVNTRPEYYTIPPMDKISEYKNNDGTCFIKGFTIGRIGYGNVHFPEVMDVSNLNIDKLVHFRYKMLTIYSEHDEKPPVGEGLNRKAQVTLDRVYPKKDNSLLEYETDPEILMCSMFPEVLKLANLKSGAHFIDYRPETGSWVFCVDHFSTYGLTDSDEDALKDEIKDKLKQNKPIPEEETQRESEIVQRGLGGMPLNKPTAAPQGKTPPAKTVKFTKNSDRFSDKNESIGTNQLEFDPFETLALKDAESTNRDRMISSFYEEPFDFNKTEKMPQLDFVRLTEAPMDLEIIEKPPKAAKKPNAEKHFNKPFKILNPSCQIPLEQSLLPKKCLMDAAIFKGRSFKVGWGKGFTIISAASYNLKKINSEDFNPSTVLLSEFSDTTRLVRSTKPIDPFMTCLDSFMEIVLEESSFELKEGKPVQEAPFAKVKKSNAMLKKLLHQSASSTESYKTNKKMSYYHNIWKLCNTFWGACDDDTYTTRRNLLEKWLEDVTYNMVSKQLAGYKPEDDRKNCLKKTFVHMTGHQIENAAKLALDQNMPQLAMLLGQLPSNDTVRSLIENQLGFWHSSGSMELVHEDLIKIYLLISGRPICNDVNVCNKLDWIRGLALHFWYLVEPYKPINYGIQTYEEAFKVHEYAEKPKPLHGYGDNWDLLYHIMKLYCFNQTQMEVMLSPETHTNDPTDYRLSWLLQKTFSSLGVGLLSEEAHLNITTMFSSQLESMGLYQWAIFVLMFIPERELRKNRILGVLDRNIREDSSDSDFEEAIVNKLCIPAEWIHLVKAVKSDALNKYWVAYTHLGYSQRWQENHDLILKHLMPTLVCNHHFGILSHILTNCRMSCDGIYRWKFRGGLIMEFIDMWTQFYENKEESSKQELKKMQSDVRSLASRLKSYAPKTPSDYMVISELSRFCSTFHGAILKQLYTDDYSYIVQTNEFLKQLVMPFDYKYADLNKCLLNFNINSL